MIFTELRFVALFVACWITFYLVPRRYRAAVLTFWGAAFYLIYAGPFFVVVLVLAILAFFSGRRAAAWLTGIATVGLLVYFKGTTTSILVPLGFSYLSFELLHVVMERRRGRIEELSLIDLLAFVFFAPTRVAGPIKRYPDFVAAVRDAEPSSANVYAGLLRILFGLAKKYLLADVLALTVAEQTYVSSALHAWIIVFAYSLQIYFDFSAYSDIAIGLGRILGIGLPENFRWPYLAKNIREFWDRWHITLSHWVRDYVFVPVGRTLFRGPLRRSPIVIAAISYLVTFAIVGAWHGLTPAFLLWGVYHGVLLSLYHVVRLKTPVWIADHRWYEARAVRAASVMVTFFCVTLGWVPFMMPLPQAQKMLALMFGVAR
ncbi:MAG TPA: MBOAT family O-acyltransferase [Thermoanaerobaculia bacterium]|nr:MBOAT family O-acyltransferase [Thermoanaerobaculia bacterium]